MHVIEFDAGRDHIIRAVGKQEQTIAMAVVRGNSLEEVWVSPENRGQGVGKCLVAAAVKRGARTTIVFSEVMAAFMASLGWHRLDNSPVWVVGTTMPTN